MNEIDKVEIFGTSLSSEVVRRLSLSKTPLVIMNLKDSKLGSEDHDIVKRTVQPAAKILDQGKLDWKKARRRLLKVRIQDSGLICSEISE